MAALVLGLLTGSAKSSFDAQDGELKQVAANVILLDRTLAQYGPDTKSIRDQIRRAITYRLAVTWAERGAAKVATSGTTPAVEGIQGASAPSRHRTMSSARSGRKRFRSSAPCCTPVGSCSGRRRATRSRPRCSWSW